MNRISVVIPILTALFLSACTQNKNIIPAPTTILTQITTPESTNSPSPSPTVMPTITPRAINYLIKDTWTRNETETWSAVMVPSDITRDEIIKVSQEIHSKFPEKFYEFFDDTKELKEYINWAKSGNNKNVYYPEEWISIHGLGIINIMLGRDGPKWEFYTSKDRFQPSIDLD